MQVKSILGIESYRLAAQDLRQAVRNGSPQDARDATDDLERARRMLNGIDRYKPHPAPRRYVQPANGAKDVAAATPPDDGGEGEEG